MKYQPRLLREIETWRSRAEEAEETLRAIREGEVDALLISGRDGERIYTLKSADEPYRVFIETMNEGALSLTAEGTIYFCNRRFAEIVKGPSERIPGTSIFHWVCGGDKERLREIFERGKKDLGTGEVSLAIAGGTQVPVHFSIRPLRLDDIIVACAVVMDITERKAAEAKIASYVRKLEFSNRELESFAFVASHDLQEPLRKIQTFADLLTCRCGDSIVEEGRDYLNRMRETAGRMKQILQSLLAYSRLISKAQPFGPVQLQQIVQEVLADLEIQIRDSEATVEVGNLPVIEADTGQIRQLFQNLIGNALKFRKNGEEPRVRIYARNEISPRREYEIYIEDNGIGFDEKYMDRIFKPFQRLHGRAEYDGIGMGLAICARVAERHGGSIRARSAPGKGSTFVVTLPVRQGEK
jgi:PAS domain S-box-containing protein